MNDGRSFGGGGGLFLSSPVFELSSHLIGTVEIKASSEVVLRLSKTSSSSSPSELLLQIPEGCLSENATFRLKGDRRCNSVYRYLVFYTMMTVNSIILTITNMTTFCRSKNRSSYGNS